MGEQRPSTVGGFLRSSMTSGGAPGVFFVARTQEEKSIVTGQSATATILTVEDDAIVRADLRLVLEEAGFEVCADARDGEEAVELARRHRPDLVLMDLGLPRVDGVEAIRRIRGNRDVPVVALTGHRSGGFVERALEAGATAHVLKPFQAATPRRDGDPYARRPPCPTGGSRAGAPTPPGDDRRDDARRALAVGDRARAAACERVGRRVRVRRADPAAVARPRRATISRGTRRVTAPAR